MEVYQLKDTPLNQTFKSYLPNNGAAYWFRYNCYHFYMQLHEPPKTNLESYEVTKIEVMDTISRALLSSKYTVNFDKKKTSQKLFSTFISINCIIIVKNITPPQTSSLPEVPIATELLNDFKKLIKDDDTNDIMFKVGEEEIKGHKFLLAIRSPVFKKMFEVDMSEKLTNEIKITDVSLKAFKALLDYINYADFKTPELAQELLYLADKYEVEGLKIRAANSLMKSITSKIAVNLLILFDRHQVPKLKTEVAKFIAKNKKEAFPENKQKELEMCNPYLFGFVEAFCEMDLN